MIAYWVAFILPAMFALVENPKRNAFKKDSFYKIEPRWIFPIIALSIFVGLRHEVGADWWPYLRSYERAGHGSLQLDWWLNDPGYRTLEAFSYKLGLGIYGVNFAGALIFSYGLIIFCRQLPRPILALAISIPYLVIVVAMGYSRQGMALGCLLIALAGIDRGHFRTFLVWTLVGATFHKSAILIFPIAVISSSKSKTTTFFWTIIFLIGTYGLLLEDYIERFNYLYLELERSSQGTLIRLTMNAVPAALILFFSNRFRITHKQKIMWRWLAAASIGLLILFPFTPSTTALDRIALYLLPLQLMAFSHLPELLGKKPDTRKNTLWILFILIYYGSVQFVWLNYSSHAEQWVPYQFI